MPNLRLPQVWRAKPSLRKLQRSNSHIMTTYYSWMWVVGLLGVVRSVMQMAEASAPHPGLYNIVWLVTRFGEGQPDPLRALSMPAGGSA